MYAHSSRLIPLAVVVSTVLLAACDMNARSSPNESGPVTLAVVNARI